MWREIEYPNKGLTKIQGTARNGCLGSYLQYELEVLISIRLSPANYKLASVAIFLKDFFPVIKVVNLLSSLQLPYPALALLLGGSINTTGHIGIICFFTSLKNEIWPVANDHLYLLMLISEQQLRPNYDPQELDQK